jgi:hypothetical protein
MSVMTRGRLTQPWKLISNRDTLLGTIVFPYEWEDLGKVYGGSFSFQLGRLIRAGEMEARINVPVDLRTVGIVWRKHPDHGPVVILHGITPEEFEKIPNCSFQPGAGYIRSLME